MMSEQKREAELRNLIEYKNSLYGMLEYRTSKGRDTADVEAEIAEVRAEIEALRNMDKNA